MIIRLTAHVGVFSAQVECESTADADKFITWVYALEGREERQAIDSEQRAPIDPPLATPTSTVSVEDAVKAVKEYAAKHSLEKARELMQKHGVNRTSEITAETASTIFAEVKAVK